MTEEFPSLEKGTTGGLDEVGKSLPGHNEQEMWVQEDPQIANQSRESEPYLKSKL